MSRSRVALVAAAALFLAAGCGAVAGSAVVPSPTPTPEQSQSCTNQAQFASGSLKVQPPTPGATTGGAASNSRQIPGFHGPRVYDYATNLKITGPGKILASVPMGHPPLWSANVAILNYGNGCFVHVWVSIQPGLQITLPITAGNEQGTSTYNWKVTAGQ